MKKLHATICIILSAFGFNLLLTGGIWAACMSTHPLVLAIVLTVTIIIGTALMVLYAFGIMHWIPELLGWNEGKER